jgi:hypothetical protein
VGALPRLMPVRPPAQGPSGLLLRRVPMVRCCAARLGAVTAIGGCMYATTTPSHQLTVLSAITPGA